MKLRITFQTTEMTEVQTQTADDMMSKIKYLVLLTYLPIKVTKESSLFFMQVTEKNDSAVIKFK